MDSVDIKNHAPPCVSQSSWKHMADSKITRKLSFQARNPEVAKFHWKINRLSVGLPARLLEGCFMQTYLVTIHLYVVIIKSHSGMIL